MNAAAAPTAEETPRLKSLIHAPDLSIDVIAAYLDGLDHETRVAELSITTRDDQRALFEKAPRPPR